MVKLFPSQPQWSTCKTGQLVLTTRTSAGFLIWSIQLFCAFPRRVHHTTPLDSSYFHTKCHGCHPLFITHNWILYKIREHLAFCSMNIRTIKISCSMFSGSVSWGSALRITLRHSLPWNYKCFHLIFNTVFKLISFKCKTFKVLKLRCRML